jgi:hypothetical protein
MKHSERTHISEKILYGTKGYSFSSWSWTHTVSVTQGCASKWFQGFNIHSKHQWIPNWTRKITHTNTYTCRRMHIHTYKVQTCCSLFSEQIFYLQSIQWQGWTDEKSLNPRTAWCTPSIPIIRMWGFLSRILMHTLTVDILNEREIVGTLKIFIKSKESSSLCHYGYYTHPYAHTNTQTHTYTPVLEAWGEKRAIAEILGLPNVRTLSCLKIIIQLRKIHVVISFQQCPSKEGIQPLLGQWRNKH